MFYIICQIVRVECFETMSSRDCTNIFFHSSVKHIQSFLIYYIRGDDHYAIYSQRPPNLCS